MALLTSERNIALPDISDRPYHPPASFVYPKREFGKKNAVKRSFQSSWFAKWTWLHYCENADVAFCHTCVLALKQKKMQLNRGDTSFVSKGFSNWKDATIGFRNHESSISHKEALQVSVLPNTCSDIGDMLSKQHADMKKLNRECFLKILSNIQFMARQGLAFRGDGDEVDSNFMQLLKLRGRDDPRIEAWIQRKTDKYVSHDMQNELLKVMALSILRRIAGCISTSKFYCIMCDECTDTSNREQLVICIRWIDQQLQPQEDFIGLYKIDDISASTIVATVKDALVRMNLALSRCRGQCYDGAATMMGTRNGVAKQLSDEENRAVFIHCYGHALNLAVGDSVKCSKLLKDALEITFEVSKLVKYSPKRDVIFEKLKDHLAPDTPGFRVLCPTRWTVRANSLQSVLDNYSVLQELWEESKDKASDPSVKARIIGVQAQFKKFSYFFGVLLGELILQHSDNLSKALQSPKLSASEGQRVAAMTVKTLQSLRSDSNFDLFWRKAEITRQKFDIDAPELPRKRKLPRRLDDGNAEPEFSSDCKQHFRQQYFEAFDLIVNSITGRFDQIGYKVYKNLQDLLINAIKNEPYEDELSFVKNFYGDDIDPFQLKLHLQILATNFPNESVPSLTIFDIKDYILSLSLRERALLSEVCTILELILVLPSTNAVSERSFSAMRRVKTYLRSTMGQERLNNLLTLHVHKDHTDELDLMAVANEFVSHSEHRLSTFGKF